MDARLDPTGLLDVAPADAHVIRNAGGIVTEDLIRSLVVSQRVIGTHEIAVLQHTDCGMQRITDAGLLDEIEAETGIRPAFAPGAFTDPAASVVETVRLLRENPFVAHAETARGYVFDVDTRRLDEVDLP
jgi:carbonic anhydrase